MDLKDIDKNSGEQEKAFVIPDNIDSVDDTDIMDFEKIGNTGNISPELSAFPERVFYTPPVDSLPKAQEETKQEEEFFLFSLYKRVINAYNRLPKVWKAVITVYVTLRLITSFCVYIGHTTIPANPPVAAETYMKPGYTAAVELVFGLWERSDTFWYLHIAKDWYNPETMGSAFLPLYPALIRAAHFLSFSKLPLIVCAFLISNVFFIFGLYYLYKITEMEFGEDNAERTIWYQALFPGSIFMFAPYTEPIFLCIAAAAFYAAKKKNWVAAGLAGALLGFTRNIGTLIIIPLAIEFIRQRYQKPAVKWKQALGLLLVGLGPLGVMFFYRIFAGDSLAFIKRSANWQRVFTLPWLTYIEGVKQAGMFYLNQDSGGIYMLDFLAVTFAIVMGILAFKYLPLSYTAYLWIALIPPLSNPFPGRMLSSDYRYVSVLFPMFIVLAILLKGKKQLDFGIRLLFMAILAISATLYTTWHNMF